MRGLGFGVGFEKLPSFFASFGANITATDARWYKLESQQLRLGLYLDRLFSSEFIDRESFDAPVHFEYCDMKDIPERFSTKSRENVPDRARLWVQKRIPPRSWATEDGSCFHTILTDFSR
jgi:hypothetical protein